jgi:hypothetical protein
VPVNRSHLTRTEQDKHFAIAQRLHADGVAIEIPEEWQSQSQYLDTSISPDSTIYVLRTGMTLYSVYARLQAQCSNLALDDFDILPTWDPGVFPCGTMKETYRFTRSLEYDPEDVLNHRIERSLRFRRAGDRVEGWLLGIGIRPVPEEYGPRKPAPFKLSFLDQLRRTYDASVVALVDRTAKIPEVPIRRTSVFAEERSSTSSVFTQRDGGAGTSHQPFPAGGGSLDARASLGRLALSDRQSHTRKPARSAEG